MWFGIIKQLLPLSEGDMTICSPSTGYNCPRAILPASGEQIVMSPSLKGNNCIIYTGLRAPAGKYYLLKLDLSGFSHSGSAFFRR